MIKFFKYIESDIDNMKFNHWGRILKNSKCLRNIKAYLENSYSYTIYDDKPVAILSFHEYDKDKYDGCIIADEDFDKNPKYAIKMKWLINRLVKDFKPERIQTTSEDSPALNKWHEFLGFELEKKDYYVKNRIKYNLWGMKWEQRRL